ncbi:hypothetical protein SteCoe_35488 [Stentor coeruleus]|uniref:NlpC/P60 domain-containing protein n=1 Tax=Stentor coeruleus TaxID=5963 RepID=A0A1R2AS86_9CILI|nr:hypothetical protein SteCoe_35488 [Stentor coeruleus]
MEQQEDFFAPSSKGSLQGLFLTFLQERKRQIKYKNVKCKVQEDIRQSDKYKETLRQKFLDKAKSYIGVPYAKRYHEPGTKSYESPLFLDCCALVRQTVDDLKEDFGFRIGRWNQAYQYDVLGDEIPFEAMRPGDLIFYSATYYDTKKRRQIHDMVHVEIFIGGETGEQSLGARWFKGFVQIFNSYKFVSTNYYDIKFHYKSIDLWLQGICKSQCNEHLWGDDRKYNWLTCNSIFAEENENEVEISTETNDTTPGKEKKEEANEAEEISELSIDGF